MKNDAIQCYVLEEHETDKTLLFVT